MSHSAFSSAASTSYSSSRVGEPLITLGSPRLFSTPPSSGRARAASNESESSVDSLDTAYEEALSFFQSVANDALAAESVAMSPAGRQPSQQSWASSATSPASSHARKSSASSSWTVSSTGTALTDYEGQESEAEGKTRTRESFDTDDIAWGSPELLLKLDNNARPAPFCHAPTPPHTSATTPTTAIFSSPSPTMSASLPAPAPRLASSTSTATIRAQSSRDRARKLSFTQTPIAELDIDAILEAYAVSWEDEIARKFDANSSSDSLGSLTAPSNLPEGAFPSPPFRLRSPVSTKSLVARSPTTPSRMTPPGAPVAYPNVFPSAKRVSSGPFPTRQKSAASLRTQDGTNAVPNSLAFPFPPPPIPAAYFDSASVIGSPKPSMSPRGSVASVGSRSSYASTSPGSFRWSVNTASTAPSIVDDDWHSKRGSRAGSSVRSSVASSAYVGSSSPPSFRHRAGSVRTRETDGADEDEPDDCDWLTFARELNGSPPPSTFSSRRPSLAPTEEGDSDKSETLSIKQMKALRKSASSKSSLSLHNSPSTTSLSRKMSGVSLRHLGRSTTAVARPPIPHRSASLKASLAEESYRQEAIRMA